MIVIYHDVGGCHSSSVAANIHVNNLPTDRVPSREEILNLSTFDKLKKSDQGRLIFIGTDEYGAKVYTLSRQYKPEMTVPALSDLYKIEHGSMEGLFITTTQPAVNLWMKIGGGSSRRFGWVTFGRPLVTYGTLIAYFQITDIVKQLKNEMKNKIINSSKV